MIFTFFRPKQNYSNISFFFFLGGQTSKNCWVRDKIKLFITETCIDDVNVDCPFFSIFEIYLFYLRDEEKRNLYSLWIDF